MNDKVTRYFIHFILALFPLKKDTMKNLRLDPSINDPVHVLNFLSMQIVKLVNTAIGDQQEGLNATKNELRQLVDRLNVMESIKLV